MMELHPSRGIEQTIRTYIKACNEADADAIASCFLPEAAHYHPSMPRWQGAVTIADNVAKLVRERELCWTIDQLVVDGDRFAAALEWTGFHPAGRILRGVDWFILDPQTARIAEIHVYLAARPDADRPRQELIDFDYAGRGYPGRF